MRKTIQCVSKDAFWVMPTVKKVGLPFPMILQGAPLVLWHPADVAGGREKVHLVARQSLEPYEDEDLQTFRCRTRGYLYTVSDPNLVETVSWHWHPDTHEHPHVHVPGGFQGHIPTGRVTLESVVRFLIEELAITPANPHWAEVLTDHETIHRAFRSWH